MVKTASTMLPLGTEAPDFSLPNIDGRTISLADFAGVDALVVMFLCNHCPFVKHIADVLANVAREYQDRGAAFVGINSNDAENYPEDSPGKMVAEAKARGYTFPYLYDETQEVARAYRAACTPDFFIFDRNQQLVYRGQFDASRPGSEIPVTGEDLAHALDAVLRGEEAPEDQKPSIGCNIKWRPGMEPDYFQS